MRYLYELEERESSKDEGREEGDKLGTQRTKQIFKLYISGKTSPEIAAICGVSEAVVEETLS